MTSSALPPTARRHRLLLAAVVASGVVAVPATASAATFCVNAPDCSGTAVPTVQQALTSAAGTPGPDVIRIGASATPYVGPFAYTSADPVTIEGAGQGATVLDPGPVNATLALLSPASTVRDLTINTRDTSGARGLYLSGSAERVTVLHQGTEATIEGVALVDDGAFRSGTVTTENGRTVNAIGSGTIVVEDSTLSGGHTGVGTNANGLALRRSTVVAGRQAVFVAGTATIEDSVLRTTAPFGGDGALSVSSGSTVSARHLTLLGSGAGYGVSVFAYAAATSSVSLTNSIVQGFATDLRRAGVAASNLTLDVKHTRYGTSFSDGSPGATTIDGASFTSPVVFRAPVGDLRLRAGQPAIDGGDPALSTAADRRGQARADGDGDGVVRPDLGAYEYGRNAPEVRVSGPASGPIGAPLTFDASGSTDADDEALSFAWTFSDGATASGAVVTHAFSTAGPHAASITVTDEAGVARTLAHPVTIVGPSAPGPDGPGGGGGPTDPSGPGGAGGSGGSGGSGGPAGSGGSSGPGGSDTRPAVSALRVQPNVARRGATAARTTATLTVGFRLSDRADARITVAERTSGRRSGSRCAAPTAALVRKKAARCVRFVTRTTVTRKGLASGPHSLRFKRLRVGSRTLSPGRYRLTVTATDAAGRQSTPQHRTLTVRPAS